MPFKHNIHKFLFLKMAFKILSSAVFLVLLSCSLQKSRIISDKQSSYYTDSIFSFHLNEYRLHNIYLPTGFDKKLNYPVLYATDGGPIIYNTWLREKLDSLIDHKIIKPIVVVESHCNTKIADSTSIRLTDGSFVRVAFRNYDYVRFSAPSQNPNLAKRFMQHLAYFTKELIPTIEESLNQKVSSSNRYFYGVSNGGGFGIGMMNLHPELIGTYICFSPFGAGIEKSDWSKYLTYPKFFLKYGSLEKAHLHENIQHLNTIYENCKNQLDIEEYAGGHDLNIWNEKLIEVLVKLFAFEKH